LFQQSNILGQLAEIARKVKNSKGSTERKDLLMSELEKMNSNIRDGGTIFQLPLMPM